MINTKFLQIHTYFVLFTFMWITVSLQTLTRIQRAQYSMLQGQPDYPILRKFSNKEYTGRFRGIPQQNIQSNELQIFQKNWLVSGIHTDQIQYVKTQSVENNKMFNIQFKEIVDIQLSQKIQNLRVLYILTKKNIFQIDFSSDGVEDFDILNIITLSTTRVQYTGKRLLVTSSSLFVITEEQIFLKYNINSLSDDGPEYQMFSVRLTSQVGGGTVCDPKYPQFSHPSFDPNKTQNVDTQFISFWSRKGQTSTFQCSKSSPITCNQIANTFLDNSIDTSSSNMNFNFDCTKLVFEFQQQGIYLTELSSGETTKFNFQYNSNGVSFIVRYVWFMDYEDQLLGVAALDKDLTSYSKADGIYTYDIGNQSLIDSYKFMSDLYLFMEFDLEREVYFFYWNYFIRVGRITCNNNDGYIRVSTTKCFKCDQPCQSQNKTCDVQLRQCVFDQPQQQNVAQQNQYDYFLKNCNKANMLVLFATSVFPISGFFLKFISFWSAASVYVFLDINMPMFLRLELVEIYKAMNFSYLQIFKIDFTMPNLYLNQNSDNEKYSQNLTKTYQITSDFFASNLENICVCLISLVLAAILFKISKIKRKELSNEQNTNNKKMFQKKTKAAVIYRNLFTINKIQMIAGQLIGLFSGLLLGVYLLKGQREYSDIFQKVNFRIFILIIGSILIFPFLVISASRQPKKNQKESKKVKKEEKQQAPSYFMQKVTYLCLIQCNVATPFTAFLGNIPLFMSLNLIIFLLNIYFTLKVGPEVSKCRKLHNFVLFSWIILIHFSMLTMHFFDNQNYQYINQTIGIFCTYIILLGAIHQLFNLVFLEMLYDFIYQNISQKYRKVPKIANIYKANMKKIKTHNMIEQKGGNKAHVKDQTTKHIRNNQKIMNNIYLLQSQVPKFSSQVNQAKDIIFENVQVKSAKSMIKLKKQILKSKKTEKALKTKHKLKDHLKVKQQLYIKDSSRKDINQEQY